MLEPGVSEMSLGLQDLAGLSGSDTEPSKTEGEKHSLMVENSLAAFSHE